MAVFLFSTGHATAAGVEGREIVLLALGDSLTAGYGLPPNEAFPVQLEAALRSKGYNVRVINSGVSGDTAAEGYARLDWSLGEPVDGAILEFGANDALRGLEPKVAEQSLDAILQELKARHIEVLLAGMEAPRNWGAAYSEEFRAIYPALAAKYGTLLYPFFLKGVAMNPALNLADGLHPTGDGVRVIVQNILPDVEKLIARIKEGHRPGSS